MTEPEAVLESLLQFIRRKLPGLTISGATDIEGDLPFDSLDRMELFGMIEKAYAVVIEPDAYLGRRLKILGNLAAFIAEHQAAKRS